MVAPLKHDPEKHALGYDPMGEHRFSEKIMRKTTRQSGCGFP
jgi:hypothetical protein